MEKPSIVVSMLYCYVLRLGFHSRDGKSKIALSNCNSTLATPGEPAKLVILPSNTDMHTLT